MLTTELKTAEDVVVCVVRQIYLKKNSAVIERTIQSTKEEIGDVC